MTINYYFFDSAPIYQADWSKTIGKALQDGVLCGVYNDLYVYGDASGMQVKVKSGAMHIKGHYYFSDAEQVLAIGAAPGTVGQSRYDLVVGEVNWTTKAMSIKVVQGTASSTPVMPSLTKSSTIWQTPIGMVQVAYGDTNVAANKVHDYRRWALGTFKVPLIIGNGVSTISTGVQKVAVEIPAQSKIVRYALYGDASGSIVIDLWRDYHINYPPTDADTICTSGQEPTLSSARFTRKTVWNEATYINANGVCWPNHVFEDLSNGSFSYDWTLLANVDSVSGLLMANLSLTFARMVAAQS